MHEANERTNYKIICIITKLDRRLTCNINEIIVYMNLKY
jgi:hypothetical protein